MGMSMKRWLRRGELAKALGTTSPTLKYYTAIGLLPADKRTPHGQYLYDMGTVKERFDRIRQLKEDRLTLDEIKDRLKIELLMRD